MMTELWQSNGRVINIVLNKITKGRNIHEI
jgi:hypothetical protein